MRRKMKRVVGLATTITLIATMTACGTDEANTAEHETYEKDLNKVEEVTVPEETAEEQTTETTDTVDNTWTDDTETADSDELEVTDFIEDTEEYYKIILQESMGDLALVDFAADSKTYYIIPVDDNLIMTIADYASYGLHAQEWNDFVGNLLSSSDLLVDELGYGYSIKMVNPANIARTLIHVKDGEIITRI